jgi:hypothetical protein
VAAPIAPTGPAPAPTVEPSVAFPDWSPAERQAVERFLQKNPTLRPATDSDCRDTDDAKDMRHLYGIYHPYFVRGDVNDDGRLDFLQAFVNRNSDANALWFTIVVFPGQADGAYGPPVVIEREVSLADGDLTIDRDAILVTPDLSQDATRRYRWNPIRRSYDFVTADAGDGSSEPPASRT